MVEHAPCKGEVPGSRPGAPLFFFRKFMDRQTKILKIIKEIDTDKRNYSRRANYKIKKLRGILDQIIEGESPEEIAE